VNSKTRIIAVVLLCGLGLVANRLPSLQSVGKFVGGLIAEQKPADDQPVTFATIEPIEPLVANYCDALAAAVPAMRDLGHFYASQAEADRALQDSGQLPGGGWLVEFDKTRAARLEKALAGNLDPSRTDLAAIAVELRVIATELRQ
jgi:hypothetical protein